jgi:PAS domain-containing protein
MRSQGRVLGAHGDQPSRVLGVVWDVTQLRHAEQKLMDANRRLDFLVTESPAVVFTYDLQPQPRLKYISRNVESILGWKPERFTENFERWRECLHPADLSTVLDGLVQLERRFLGDWGTGFKRPPARPRRWRSSAPTRRSLTWSSRI